MKNKYTAIVLVLIVLLFAAFYSTFWDYYVYRKQCYEHSDVAVYSAVVKGLPWEAESKSDAQWIVRNFPDVPFVRYEGKNSDLYDLRDAGRVMGRAHDYEEKIADLDIKPAYFLKRNSGNVKGSSRIRYYRSAVVDMQRNDEVIVTSIFAFTWWTIGGEAYGVSNKTTCFDPDAIEKIQKAFKSKE